MFVPEDHNVLQTRQLAALYISELERRQEPQQPGPSGTTISPVYYIAILVVVAIIIGGFGTYSYLRSQRAKNKKPWFIPASMEPRWWAWRSLSARKPATNGRRRQDLESTETLYQSGGDGNNTTANVNRQTSVRSVISLPPYSSDPKDNERILGREGERAGMDTVVEFPETADEEETRRDQEMDDIYQLRMDVQRQRDEREERARQRREARERNDIITLERLRREAVTRAQEASRSTASLTADQTPAQMLAEIQARGRDRRVSSVSYADVGRVRHDGSRLRSGSPDSERNGLLGDAASMGRLRGYSNASSIHSAEGRQRSRGSSVSSQNSGERPNQITPQSTNNGSTRTRQRSDTNDEPSSSSPVTGVTPGESATSDIGESRIIPFEEVHPAPPDYDNLDWGDAPTYEEAVRRAMSNATVRSLRPAGVGDLNVPSINIEGASEPNTPAIAQTATMGSSQR